MNYIYIVFLMSSLFLNAQQNINGIILDFHDGTPLENAEVKLITNTKVYSTNTNSKGEFYLENVPNGNFDLEINHFDCEKIIKKIDIPLKEKLIIRLEHHEEELMEVKTIIKNEFSKTLVQKNISQSTIDKYKSQNLGNALTDIVGVQSISTGSAIVKPMIDGVHSSRLVLLNNGVRQQDAEWGIEHAPVLSLNSINKISVIKGTSTLQFASDAIGGIILTEKEKSNTKDTIFGKIQTNYQTNSRAYSAAGNIQKAFKNGLNIAFDIDYRKNGDFSAPDYVLSNTGNSQNAAAFIIYKKTFKSGFEAYYSYVNNKIGILRSAHIGNVQDLANAIQSKQPLYIENFTYEINSPRQEITHNLAKLNFYQRFAEAGKLEIQYSFQNNHRQEFDIRRGERSNIPAIDLTLNSHQFTSDFSFDSKENRKIKTGIFGSYFDNFTNPNTGVRPLIPNYQEYKVGYYAFLSQKIKQNWNFEIASRIEYTKLDAQKWYEIDLWEKRNYATDFGNYIEKIDLTSSQLYVKPEKSFLNFSNSFGLTYLSSSNWKWIFNISYLMRNPNASELFSDGLHHSAAQIELGDLRLKKEESFKINLNLTKKIPILDDLDFNIDAYYSSNKNFIYARPTGTEITIRGAFPVLEFQQVEAVISGINANYNLKITKNWDFGSNFSYTYGENKTENLPLISIAPFKMNHFISFTKNEWKDFSVKLNYEYTAFQNRFPIYNPSISYFENNQIVTKEVDLSSPPENYSLFNLETGVKYKWKNKSLSFGIFVQNLFGISYRNYLNRLRYFSDEIGRNIQLNLSYGF